MIKIKESQGAFNSTNYKSVRDSSEDFTGYYLTIEEYNNLNRQIKTAELRAERAEKEALENKPSLDDKMRNLKQQQQNNDIIAKYDEAIKALKSRLSSAEKANKDLKRIAIERANAKRNIRPKKERSGYIAITQKQTTFNKKNCWLTIIQSPFSASIDFLYVRKEFEKAYDFPNLIKTEYKENYKSGFWEISVYTEKHLNLPDDMRITA